MSASPDPPDRAPEPAPTSKQPPAQLSPSPTDSSGTPEKPRETSTDASPIDPDSIYISFRAVHRVPVSVRSLTITVTGSRSRNLLDSLRRRKTSSDQTELRILDDVSADIPAGQVMAIIGGSGSGKTSMLNVMAHRMKGQGLRIAGETLYDGSNVLEAVRSAYVMQQDVLLPRLTVRETLRYSAGLRLPASASAEERERVVEEVILQLGLKECADTMIGDSQHKGCSGGEKRRVSIGVQLLANPSVLFLDEPTTGLDSTSAYQLVMTLKNLAKKGRTIITTLHQPRSEIWRLFDRITLLSRGCALYSGSVERVVPYFEGLGHHLPEHYNPADFLIDLSAVDYRNPEAEEASTARVKGLIAAWREHEPTMLAQVLSGTSQLAQVVSENPSASGYTEDKHEGATRLPIWRQVSILTRRTLRTTYRDPMGASGTFFIAIAMGTIVGWVFYQLPEDLMGIRSRQAALYITCSMHGYLILLLETYRLCTTDIHVFDREHGEGVVSTWAFLISRRIAKGISEDILVPLIFSSIMYFMAGFDANGSMFFVYFLAILLSHYIAVSFSMFAVSISRNFAEAALVGNLWFTLQSMASGYFVQTSNMPVYVRWTKYICYIWYGFNALINSQFAGRTFDCPEPGGSSNPSCLQYDGDFIARALDVKPDWIAIPLVIIVAWIVGFYIAGGIILATFTVDINMAGSKTRKEDQDTSAGKEKMSQREDQGEVRTIDVVLDDLKLSVHKPGFFGKGGLDRKILMGVSTRFEAGKLNVIMGPSGSGKSSLLNLMARRLYSSVRTKYSSSGTMLLNGTTASDSVIRSLCSYVTQDDDALLPSLTVRETLRFVAALRLPKWMSKSEKQRRAEEVILKLGLKDCADILIGSEFLKGISGGQKRRVTIAVQILTEPKILLLDEPTSGLDAFTASSIISVLKGLADEGRTIICTIHQSRTDLFDSFGNILLLARGGHTVYSGAAAQMLPYFAAQGHHCPGTTNPADFALDLVTVDLQHAQREAATREKVDGLIGSFSPAAALADPNPRAIALPAELGQMQRETAPFRIAFPVLVRRAIINFRRQPALIVARIMQVLGLGIILGLFFAPLKNDYYSAQTRMGYVQQILPLNFVGMLQNMALYPNERDVFYKEHTDRAYSVDAFFWAYTACELPFELFTSLVFSLIGSLAVGLPRTASMYFVVAANTFCVVNFGESIGIIFNTVFSQPGFSVNVMSTLLSISTIMAGVMNSRMPVVLDALNYLSPLKYIVQNMAHYSLEGVEFYCTDEQKLGDGSCPIETGEQVRELYGLDGYSGWKNLVITAGVCAGYRVVAYAAVRIRRMEWGVGTLGERKRK